LLDAGAIVLGKTNLQELAYGPTNNNAAFGPARNPYDPTRIPTILGRRIVKVEPRPGSLSTVMSPPII